MRNGSTWSQQGSKLVGTGAVGSARQGSAVSLSADGNTAMVGGYQDSSSAGAVWVYTRSGSTWTQQGSKLVGTGAVGAAGQGLSCALSADGNTAIVGGDWDNNYTGATWVYTRTGSNWSQRGAKLIGTGVVGAAYQGYLVSLSADGSTAIVGGQFDNSNAGAAWVYVSTPAPTVTSFSPATGPVGTLVTISGTNLNAGTPTVSIGGVSAIIISNTGTSLVAMVMPGATTGGVSVTTSGGTTTAGGSFTVTATPYPGAQQGSKLVGTPSGQQSRFGSAVAVSADGNTAIIGAPLDASARIYTRSGNTWTQEAQLSGGTGSYQMGLSVALSADGNTALAGDPYSNGGFGGVWVFVRSGTTWSRQGNKLTGTGGTGFVQYLGISVSLSADGNTAIAGGSEDTLGVGATWVFTRSGNVWTQQGSKLVGLGSIGAAEQGASVAISADGRTLIVGGYGDNNNIGAAWIFTQSGGVWSQQGPKLTSSSYGAVKLGTAVAISADGNTAVVGGPNGNSVVLVYSRTGGAWTQQSSLPLSYTGGADMALAISADGNTAIVGGADDNNGIGATWVFAFSGNSWIQKGPKLLGSGSVLTAPYVFQGWSVALSANGNTAISGGWYDDNRTGAAWVYVPCAPVTPSVSIAASATTLCSGIADTFTATPTNGGSTPSYQWFKNGTAVGSNSATFITSSLSNNDSVWCVMTSNASCASPISTTSTTIQITVNSAPVVGASPTSQAISAGNFVGMVTGASGIPAPSVQWQVSTNGGSTYTDIPGVTVSTYAFATQLSQNGYRYRAYWTNVCGITYSGSAVLTVTAAVPCTPSVSITATATAINSGAADTFRATPVNGGTSPSYQWYRNGSAMGTNSATFIVSTLANGDSVWCVMTSSATCASPTTATSPKIRITVSLPPISLCDTITITSSGANEYDVYISTYDTMGYPSHNNICAIDWTIQGVPYTARSLFKFPLSSLPPSAVITSATLDLFCDTANYFQGHSLYPGTPYPLANDAAVYRVTQSWNPFTVNWSSQPAFTTTHGAVIPATTTRAQDESIDVTNMLADMVQSPSTSFGFVLKLNNEAYYRAQNYCSSNHPNVAKHPRLRICYTVPNTGCTPSVSIAATTTTQCSGSLDTFTATPASGITAATYIWYKNGTPVSTSGPVYITNALVNNDSIWCVMTVTTGCAGVATSNKLHLSINPIVHATVSLSASDTVICEGTQVSLYAYAPITGTGIAYSFYQNGSLMQQGSNPVYTTDSMLGGGYEHMVCDIAVSGICSAYPYATSNSVYVHVNSLATPSVSLAASSTTICANGYVVFSATPVNGGTLPSYSFYVNGVNIVNDTSSTFDTRLYSSRVHLHDGDSVWVVMNSSLPCAAPNGVQSNVVHINVINNFLPSVTLALRHDSVCSGTYDTVYVASTVGAGTSSGTYFMFYLNGQYAGTATSQAPYYVTTSFNNGDSVTCVMVTDNPCANTTQVTSNKIKVHVVTSFTPQLSLSLLGTAPRCSGSQITVQANCYNHGHTANFRFFVNGVRVFDTVSYQVAYYRSSTLNNGDTVTCTMTPNSPCSTVSSDTRSIGPIAISSSVAPSVTITASGTCSGVADTFTATATNGGTAPTYIWYKNGTAMTTSSGATYISPALAAGDSLWCVVQSNAPCASPSSATSNKIRINNCVTCLAALSITCSNSNLDIAATRTMTATATSGGTAIYYHWYMNGTLIPGVHSYTFSYGGTLGNGDQIYCTIVPNSGCAMGQTLTSNIVTFTKSGSTIKDIVTFVMPAQVGTSVINNAAATVSAVVTTAPALRTAIHPIRITVSTYAAYGPSYITNRDFSMPVTYTVAAQNGTTKVWTVTVVDQSGNKTNATNDNLNALADMTVYPDPATAYINVQATGGVDAPVITILDMEGRVMYHQALPITNYINHQIDLSDFAVGSYIMYVAVGEKLQSRQFVVGK